MIVKYCPSLGQGRVLNNKGRRLCPHSTGHRMPSRLRSESSLPSSLPQLAHIRAGLLHFQGEGRNRSKQNGPSPDGYGGVTLAMLPHITTPFPAHKKHWLRSGCPCWCLLLLHLQGWVQHIGRWVLTATLPTLLPACPQVVPDVPSFGLCRLQWLAFPAPPC